MTLLTFVFFLPIGAVAGEYQARFAANLKKPLPGLTWSQSTDTQFPLVKSCPRNQGIEKKYCVNLEGVFVKKNNSLLFNLNQVKLDSDGHFKILFELQGKKTLRNISSIEIDGTKKDQEMIVAIADWNEMIKSFESPSDLKKLILTPGLGVSSISYQQFGTQDLSEIAISVKITGAYRLSEKWDLGANAFYTVLPMMNSPTDTSIRFLAGNMKIGYLIAPDWAGWSFSLQGGWYYSTSMASSVRFGYSHIQGPQLFPILTRVFSKGNFTTAYFKYSPIVNNFKLMSFSNAEMAFGMSYFFAPMENGNALGVGLDVAMLKFELATGLIQSNSYTLGVSYRFNRSMVKK